MNDDTRQDRDIAAFFAVTAPPRGPEGLLDDVFLTTGRMRPRPRWLAVLKEPPMRISTRVAVGSPTSRLAAIVVLTLLLAVAATAGVIGAASVLQAPTPVGRRERLAHAPRRRCPPW
jgi:hypothetical protein